MKRRKPKGKLAKKLWGYIKRSEIQQAIEELLEANPNDVIGLLMREVLKQPKEKQIDAWYTLYAMLLASNVEAAARVLPGGIGVN